MLGYNNATFSVLSFFQDNSVYFLHCVGLVQTSSHTFKRER